MLYSSLLVTALAAASANARWHKPTQEVFLNSEQFEKMPQSNIDHVDAEQHWVASLRGQAPRISNSMADGNPNTFYCTPWEKWSADGQRVIEIGIADTGNPSRDDEINTQHPETFGAPLRNADGTWMHNFTLVRKDTTDPVAGLTYLPRQDSTPRGDVGDYAIYYSNDNVDYRPLVKGTFPDDKSEKQVTWCGNEVKAKYIRFQVRSEAGNRGQWGCAAEIALLKKL